MFHWTAALKEEKLLFNFFKRLRFNTTDRYPEFRYSEYKCKKKSATVTILDSYPCVGRREILSDAKTDRSYSTTQKFFQRPQVSQSPNVSYICLNPPNVSYIYLNCNSQESLGISCTIMLGTSQQFSSSHIWLPWCRAQVSITKPFLLKHLTLVFLVVKRLNPLFRTCLPSWTQRQWRCWSCR